MTEPSPESIARIISDTARARPRIRHDETCEVNRRNAFDGDVCPPCSGCALEAEIDAATGGGS